MLENWFLHFLILLLQIVYFLKTYIHFRISISIFDFHLYKQWISNAAPCIFFSGTPRFLMHWGRTTWDIDPQELDICVFYMSRLNLFIYLLLFILKLFTCSLKQKKRKSLHIENVTHILRRDKFQIIENEHLEKLKNWKMGQLLTYLSVAQSKLVRILTYGLLCSAKKKCWVHIYPTPP